MSEAAEVVWCHPGPANAKNAAAAAKSTDTPTDLRRFSAETQFVVLTNESPKAIKL
jgi:hypothetical protein